MLIKNQKCILNYRFWVYSSEMVTLPLNLRLKKMKTGKYMSFKWPPLRGPSKLGICSLTNYLLRTVRASPHCSPDFRGTFLGNLHDSCYLKNNSQLLVQKRKDTQNVLHSLNLLWPLISVLRIHLLCFKSSPLGKIRCPVRFILWTLIQMTNYSTCFNPSW